MWKVGLVGAGYIAEHHLKALNQLNDVQIVAICDGQLSRVQDYAKKYGLGAYSSLEDMLDSEKLHVVHILTQPDSHLSLAEIAVARGLHVFIEKPMGFPATACKALDSLAAVHNVHVGVNHNILFYRSYQQFKRALQKKEIGPVEYLTLDWQKNMEIIHRGPFNAWMLREPQNLWLETAPHICALLIDILDNPQITEVEVGEPVQLLSGKWVYPRWTIKGPHFEVRLSHQQGFEERVLKVLGLMGNAEVDFERDTCVLKRHTLHSLPLDSYAMVRSEASQLKRQSWQNLWKYIVSKILPKRIGDPFGASIAASVVDFYKSLNSNYLSLLGEKVITLCETVVAQAPLQDLRPKSQPVIKSEANLLVLGGSGFIGRALTEALLQRGEKVRVITRDPDKLYPLANGCLDIVKGDILDEKLLKEALKGIDTVFHLATAHVKTWDDYWHKDVGATKKVGEACLSSDVQKLIYTGTIDSYYAGNVGEVITEETPYDPKLSKRNYYARAKALGEKELKDMRLPLIVVRPGIVLGKGSSPCHWGVGMWYYESACRLWGEGANPLPLVWLNDVVQGLLLAMDTGVIGHSYNLIDAPVLSAKDYIAELEKVLQAKIETIPTPIWKFFGEESFKWLVKLLVRHRDRKTPSWRDWKSRTQLATFSNQKACQELGWRPIANRENMIEEGIRLPARYWWK